MIKRLEEVLEVNYLMGDDLLPFQKLSESVYENFVARGVLSNEDIREAKAAARSDGEGL